MNQFSRRNSLPGISRAMNPGQSINDDPESSPETLENLIRVTQNTDSIIQAYYTDDNGDVVTLSVYDISNTDPTDILGNDIIDRHEAELMEEHDDDFDEAVARRLERLKRRASQRSGDSFFEIDEN